ncbi:MAG: glycosyltransferase [Xenococcus sp. (in: cyanobacteria)]
MKKLLQINSVVNTGSTGRIAEEIGALATAHGWESHIAYGRYGNPSTSNSIKIGGVLDTYWHVLQTKLFDKHGMASKRATKKFVKKIEQINPDIIHLHNIHGYYINIKILFDYLALKSIPVVWTLHDCWSFTGHCSYFDMAKCDKWKTECNKCPQKNGYPSSLFADRSKENFYLKKELFNSLTNLKLVPVSEWLNALVNNSFLNKVPTRVIHNGLDLEKFSNKSTKTVLERYGLKDNFVILGVANIWNRRKGFSDFIELSKNLDANERIVLVGLNDKQLKSLPKNIIGIKKTESIDELCEFYSVADVFVNLTYEDNFPTTNIEALACGTPVITYKTGGSPEAISEKSGFVVDQGSIELVLKYTRRIKEQKKENYAKSCRERAEEFFDKNSKYNEYLDLYNELLNK